MRLQKDLTESATPLSNSNSNSMSEYRRVIPLNEKIIEDINLEENERENDEISEHKKDHDDINQHLQLLIKNGKRSETMDNILYIYDLCTYANMKLATRWFMETASLSFTFSVRFYYLLSFLNFCIQ